MQVWVGGNKQQIQKNIFKKNHYKIICKKNCNIFAQKHTHKLQNYTKTTQRRCNFFLQRYAKNMQKYTNKKNVQNFGGNMKTWTI